jgi:GYF domain 2
MKGDPMTTPLPETSRTPAEKRWWVAIRQKAEGPYTAEQILSFVQTSAIPADAQACLFGTRQWAPLSDWPDFNDASALVPPPIPPSIELVDSHPLTSRQLPSMANCICVYCIGLRPVISGFGILAAMMTAGSGPSGRMTADDIAGFVVFAFTTLAITTALVMGGVLLRHLRESGPTIIKFAIWTSLGCVALVSAFAVLSAMASSNAQQPPTSAPSTTAGGLFVLLVYLLELAFQIIAVIWLHRHSKSLPFVAR